MMIPRTLVPFNARPPAADDSATTRRRPTTLDERTLVPAMLPIVHLDGRSTIPTNLPLESIATRVVVPRDLNAEAFGVREDSTLPLQPTELDERVAIPVGAAPPSVISAPKNVPTDVVDLDVFMTGEVQFMPAPKSTKQTTEEWIRLITSVSLHALIILMFIFQSKLFPSHGPTAEQMEIARKQMTLLVPPGAFDTPAPMIKPTPRVPPVHVDPRVLRQVAPPIEPPPVPAPQPERAKELPSAPTPQPNATPPPVTTAAPKVENPPLKLETPDAPQPQKGLLLPKISPHTAIQDSLRTASKNAGGRSGAISGPMPKSPGSPGSIGGAGQGGGTFGNGYEILTPTEGVDFSDYMARVLASVRRNWYAVMPESAQLGDRGRVMLQFRIMKNGSVPGDEPNNLMSSGKEPLDRAAVSAIRSSNPFPPLPPAFSGPYIELRFIFLYNLPLEAANQ